MNFLLIRPEEYKMPQILINQTTSIWANYLASYAEQSFYWRVISLCLTKKTPEVITSKISLILIPYDHRQKTIPSWLCVCNSVIRLFPETNPVRDKIFRSKHELMLEKYFNVFEDVFEKSNT